MQARETGAKKDQGNEKKITQKTQNVTNKKENESETR